MSVNGITGRTGAQIQSILSQQKQLDTLQQQLGTGQKSDTYAGLGLDRSLSVALRTQLATLQTYQQSSTIIGTRLSVAQTALTQVGQSSSAVKDAALNSSYSIDQTGQTIDQTAAKSQLDLIISALNSQVGDQYIFSGKSPDVQPVETLDHILNGNGSQAGFNQIVAERKLADLGSNGLGRLTLPPIVSSAASLVGTGATLTADAPAVVTGSQNIGGAFASGGGSLVINGTTVNIGAGANAAAVLAAINAPGVVAATGVTASLNGSNNLVLTSANASTAITIGAGSTLLGELGVSAATTNPNNLLTQGAVTAGQTLTVTIGANPPLTITFGTNGAAVPPEVSTLAQLNAQISGLVGNGASAASRQSCERQYIDHGNNDWRCDHRRRQRQRGCIRSCHDDGVAIERRFSERGRRRPSVRFQARQLQFDIERGHRHDRWPAGAIYGQHGVEPHGRPSHHVQLQSAGRVYRSANPDGHKCKPARTQRLHDRSDTGRDGSQFQDRADRCDRDAGEHVPDGRLRRRRIERLFQSRRLRAAACALPVHPLTPRPRWSPVRAPIPSAGICGESGSTPARATATARADTSITVSYGMRASEQALRNSVANIAVFSSVTFSASDPNAKAAYAALTQRVSANLTDQQGVQKVSDIEAEIANAQTTLASAQGSAAADQFGADRHAPEHHGRVDG